MNILFVCTGNTCRSPMAAALMNKIAEDSGIDVKATSAGIFAESGTKVSENAVLAMREFELDIESHRAVQLNEEMIKSADIVLTMTEGQKMMILSYAPEKIFSVYEFIESEGDVKDPFGGDLDEYNETAQEIYDVLLEVAEELLQ